MLCLTQQETNADHDNLEKAGGENLTIYDNIEEICHEKRIPLTRLEQDVGLARSNIFKWKANDPGSKRLKAVAEYLGVTTDRLLEGVPAWKPKEGD